LKTKLTEVDVIQIRRARAAGEDQVSIARRFGIDQSAVSRIVRHLAWKHVAHENGSTVEVMS
jgi:hypothetical protein